MKPISKKIIGTLAIALLIVGVIGAVGVVGKMTTQVAYAQAAPKPADPPKPAAPPAGDKKDGAATPGGAASPPDAAVQGLGSASLGSMLPNDIVVQLAKILAVVLRVISQILWPLLMLGGGLMKSDFLYTGLIDTKLTDLWIQMRNLVNIIYVILLIVVALYNVLGLGEMVSTLEIKKALPKIILGLILVNFSYTGIKVILDVVNAGTVFAFSLPRTDPALMQSVTKDMIAAKEDICGTLVSGGESLSTAIEQSPEMKAAEKAKANAAAAEAKKKGKTGKKPAAGTTAADTGPDASSTGGICVKDAKTGKMVPNPAIYGPLQTWNMDGSLAVMAVKFMRLQTLSTVSDKVKSGGIAGLTIEMLLSLAMYLIYGVSFIVLIIVLFARAAILWMVIVFSPLIVLNLTFPNLLQGVGSGIGGKVVKTILSPIIIGFVLSIGFIIMSTLQMYNFGTAATITTDTPSSSLDTFQDMLIAIGSVVFVWMGVEAAIDGTIASGVAGTVMQAAKSAGTWIAKAPLMYTPLFQIKSPHSGHGEMVDLGTIMQGLENVKGSMAAGRSERADRLFGLKGTLNLEGIKTKGDLDLKLKAGSLDGADPKKVHEALKAAKKGSPGEFNSNQDLTRALAAFESGDQSAGMSHTKVYQSKLPGYQGASAAPVATTGGSPATGAVTTAADAKAAVTAGEGYLTAEQRTAAAKVKAAKDDTGVDTAMKDAKTKEAVNAAKAAAKAKEEIAKDAADFVSKPDDQPAKDKMKAAVKAKVAEMQAAGVTGAEQQAAVIADAIKGATGFDSSKKADIAAKTKATIGDAASEAVKTKVEELIKK